MGHNSLGTSFSMRSDLPLDYVIISKDIFNYAKKGGKLMIKHKLMEEPRQMQDGNHIING